MGNGLMTFIDKKTEINDFFNKDEIVLYENIHDLAQKLNFIKKMSNKEKNSSSRKKKYFKLFNELRTTKYIIDKSLGKSVKLY